MRELENVIERAVVMSGQETLMPEAFAFDDDASDEDLVQVAGIARAAGIDSAVGANMAAEPEIDSNRAQPVESPEEGTLQDEASIARRRCESRAALAAAGGNRVDAATALGVDRTTLYRLMKRLSL